LTGCLGWMTLLQIILHHILGWGKINCLNAPDLEFVSRVLSHHLCEIILLHGFLEGGTISVISRKPTFTFKKQEKIH